MNKLTPEQLAEIVERSNKQTDTRKLVQDMAYDQFRGSYLRDQLEKVLSNIDTSRTDIPALLDHIKALEEENKQLHDKSLEDYKSICKAHIAIVQNQKEIDRINAENARYKESLEEITRQYDDTSVNRAKEIAQHALKGDSNQ